MVREIDERDCQHGYADTEQERLDGLRGKGESMKTPEQKYRDDPMYRHLVDMLEAQIHAANYTPSEMREAVILASINYEMRRVMPRAFPSGVESALNALHGFASGE